MCFAFGFEGVKEAGKHPCLDSSAVEHAAVNRGVVGSSPTRGAKVCRISMMSVDFFQIIIFWLRGQAVKTSPFHGGNTGSIPVGVIQFGDIAKW